MDSGLYSLALVAQLHHKAVDPRQLLHEFSDGSDTCSTQTLLKAAKWLGFKARAKALQRARINPGILPIIIRLSEGGYGVLAQISDDPESSNCRFLIQTTKHRNSQTLTADEFDRVYSGEAILFTVRQGAQSILGQGSFNLAWFKPSLIKYRKLFAQVLVASFFLQLFSLVTPLFFQVVMDKVLVHQGFTTLNVLAFGFAVIITFDALIGGMRNYLFSHTTTRVDIELGARLFNHLEKLPLAYFENRQIGQTVARVRELDTLRNFITGTALTLIIDLSFTFVFFVVLWYYSPSLTLIVMSTIPLYIFLSLLITPLLKGRLNEKFHFGAVNQAFLTEAVSGIQTIKSQALEPQMQQRWETQLASYVRSAFRSQNLNNIANQIAGFISKFTTLMIIWWGAHLVIAGALSVGQLVAFNMIAGRVTAPILKLVQLWQDFQQAGISLKRLGDILNTPTELNHDTNRSTPDKIQGEIRFERLRFRYHNQAPLALDEFDLDVKAGGIVGIVGRSGSGKSTLTKLLQRLYVAEAGRIQIDGMDLAMLDIPWLRRNIGVVQQESFLFHRSVRDNIALSNPAIPMDQVISCAKVAGAHEFILELKEGYDTLIEEQGANLSGGQRQRIAIARALITQPKILVLDEATSALDYESERIIQENMGRITHGRTVFVIAHRLSTVRHCDKIVVMDKGRVIESGCHDELIARNGYYAKLYSYQNHSPVIRELPSSEAASFSNDKSLDKRADQ